jgi:DnaJ-class molecular chaperone
MNARVRLLISVQKRQIYDRHGEEGLKAHEGGQQHHGNPFDMFQNFFGGGRESCHLYQKLLLVLMAV